MTQPMNLTTSTRWLIALAVAMALVLAASPWAHNSIAQQPAGALETLEARDAKVLRLYFGLDGECEHTLEEIGNMLGVTRERIRQLRDRALRRLREGKKGSALESFAA